MVVNAGAINTSRRPMMPMTMSSSRRVKPRKLSGPRSPEAELRGAETSEGWPVNPRGKARDIAHAHGAFGPSRPIPGGANIWGEQIISDLRPAGKQFLRKNSLG